jgi:hypothetical protein
MLWMFTSESLMFSDALPLLKDSIVEPLVECVSARMTAQHVSRSHRPT